MHPHPSRSEPMLPFITLLCGTLLATTAAYMAAKKDKRLASATFFTTMLDFSEPGELGIFLD